MATFSVTIADADVPKVIAALSAGVNIGFGHPANFDASSDPAVLNLTDAEFARKVTIAFLSQVCSVYELNLAQNSIVPPDIT